jgi:hypothetical protein
MEQIINDFFSNNKNKYFILQGFIGGALETFVPPIKNTTQGWDFDTNPIYNPYGTYQTVYQVFSRYTNSNGVVKNTFNMQIFIKTGDAYVLELGVGILFDNKIKFNMTEESALLGEITYNSKNKEYTSIRIVNGGNLFMDIGTFNQISYCEFKCSGITLV